MYNGPDSFPDSAVLRLSDHFKKPQDLGLPEKTHPLLELEVKVININEGRNEGIAARCKKLAEYSVLVAKVREFQCGNESLEESIKKAVAYCQKHDILKEYLEIHASEVLNMLLTEWNTEDAIAFAREEGREDGWEEGRAEGLEEGWEGGKAEGWGKGLAAVARNALAQGLSVDVIQTITGLDAETIKRIGDQ